MKSETPNCSSSTRASNIAAGCESVCSVFGPESHRERPDHAQRWNVLRPYNVVYNLHSQRMTELGGETREQAWKRALRVEEALGVVTWVEKGTE